MHTGNLPPDNESSLPPLLRALGNFLLSIKDNPMAQESLKCFAQSVLDHLEGQSGLSQQKSNRNPQIVDDLGDPCSFCGSREVVKRYDSEAFGIDVKSGETREVNSDRWYACASCAELVETKSKDELAERSLQNFFRMNHHYQETEETKKIIREAIVETEHGQFWRLREQQQNGFKNREVATTPNDMCGMHNCLTVADVSFQPQASSPSPPPQARRLSLLPSPSAINCIDQCRTVLLIGDDLGVTRMLKQRLEHEGFLVRSACDLDNGLRLYESSWPFLLVMIDFSLPNKGVELVRYIRGIDPSQRMVIVAHDYRTEKEVPCPQEMAGIPVLTDVCQLPAFLDSLRPWASRDEVSQAIQALSHADLRKIRRIAELKAWGSTTHDWEDLLQESHLRTLMGTDDPCNGKRKGKRRWDKSVDFVTFLVGSMSSIGYHSKQELRKLEAHDPTSDHACREMPADECLIQKEEVARIQARTLERFAEDSEARMVVQDLFSGMDKDEIMSKQSLSSMQYAAIMKRIRLKLLGRNYN